MWIRPADMLLKNLLEIVQWLGKKRVNWMSLRENIDTDTATGRCFLSMMGAIDQMEQKLRLNAPQRVVH